MQDLLGNLFIISAPSGAGKSTLINALLKQHADMQLSVSHTTRSPRPGESNGVQYHFTDIPAFKQLIEQEQFIEWAEVFGNYYGTSKAALTDKLAQGIDVFLDIDWQGARQIKQQLPFVTSIFILPPSVEALEQRLNQRGQDSAEVIAGRMAKARDEISHADEYDYWVVNDDLELALQQFSGIIQTQRLKQQKQAIRQQKLISGLLANETK
ncbi:guanylate kinase [Rheinheimera sp. 1928-s]|uniref:guanylate kinase n=1 Tax=Rheinheimera sp. 1928-s TaxID=3033803 RepID=UPI002622CA55|nr:guanylate kinase [Rheinheimera sp. 1928-s]MDF3123558.1 guanylate kinase [Rheinheimera sp. 1928-s]